MTFFPELQKPAADKFDADCADKLAALLKKHNLQKRKNPNAADEFAQLKKTRSPELISAVLDFYLENFRGPFVPLAFSARSFREKFDAIDAARFRVPVQPEKITVTADARRVLSMLGNPVWNNDVAQRTAPIMVQISLNRYAEFFDKLCAAYESEKTAADARAAEQLKTNGTQRSDADERARALAHLVRTAAEPVEFVVEYAAKIFRHYDAMALKSDLTAVAWNPRGLRAEMRIRERLRDWGASGDVADQILEILKKF